MKFHPGEPLLPYQLTYQARYVLAVQPEGADSVERVVILVSEYSTGYGAASVVYVRDEPDGGRLADAQHFMERSRRLALHRAELWVTKQLGEIKERELTRESSHISAEEELDPWYDPKTQNPSKDEGK